MAGVILGIWERNKMLRRSAGPNQKSQEDELMENLRNKSGEYSAEERAAIELTGQTALFLNNFDRKIRDIVTLVGAVFLNSADRPWQLDPTKVPDLSDEDTENIANAVMQEYVQYLAMTFEAQGIPHEEAMQMVVMNPPDPEVVLKYAEWKREEADNKRRQEAALKANRMQDKIEDQFQEGKWREANRDALENAASMGTGIVKGPVPRNRKRVRYTGGTAKVQDAEVLEFSAVDPFDCYPSKGAVSIQDGDLCIRVRYSPRALSEFAEMDADSGWDSKVINAILEKYPNGGLKFFEPYDNERQILNSDGSAGITATSMLEGIEFWGDARGQSLIDMGITKKDDGTPVKPNRYYPVNALVMDNKVAFCRIADDKFGRPLYKIVCYRMLNSWWGKSISNKIRDAVRSYNFAYRAKTVNIMMTSGYQTFYDEKMLGTADLKMRPYGAYPYKDPQGSGRLPVHLQQADSRIMELIASMQEDSRLFDTLSGIPSSSHASDASATAGRTYNGLLLIITASKEGANDIVHSMFLDGVKPQIEYQYAYNMEFDPDSGIKGDCNVAAGGLLSILVKEQAQNRLETFLNLAIQPAVLNIIKPSGLAELLRHQVKLLQGIDPTKVVPTEEEMERLEEADKINAQLQEAQQLGMQQEQAQGGQKMPATRTAVGRMPVQKTAAVA